MTADPWDTPDAEDAARRARLTGPDALASAARYYANQGLAIFPLRPGGKIPLHPRAHDPGNPCRGQCGRDGHGLYDATTDPARITTWWAATPQANIGLPTGRLFDVLDVDPPDGWLSLAELRGQGLVPETIGYVITARTGAHLYVAPTGRGNATGFLPGIDWRGSGGYVVAPPSRSDNGGTWEWTTPLVLP